MRPFCHSGSRGAAMPAALTIQSLRQSLHLRVKIGLTFEPYAGQFGHRDEALLHPHAIREPAVRLEKVRIALVAAQAKSGGNVERHLVSAMRDATRRRPSVDSQHLERALVFTQSVRQRAVEL